MREHAWIRWLALSTVLVACDFEPVTSSDGGRCGTGTTGCDCYGNGTCDEGLVCASGTCVEDTRCPAGSEGTDTCPCYRNGTCDAGLTCRETVCVDESRCPAGSEGMPECPCRSDGSCDGSLVCSGGACVDPPTCPPGTLSCPCDSSGGCGGSLVCGEGRCGPDPSCTPGSLDCVCAEGSCMDSLVCRDGTCHATSAAPAATYFFGVWGADRRCSTGIPQYPGPLFVARPGVHAAREIALPATVGDAAVPRLVDYADASTGFALYEDTDGSGVHFLRFVAASDSWEELPLPSDPAVRDRFYRYLRNRGPADREQLGVLGVGRVPGCGGGGSRLPLPNAVLRALSSERAVLTRLSSELARRGELPELCSSERCLISWEYAGGSWTETVQEFPYSGILVSADATSVSGYANAYDSVGGIVGVWYTLDRTTGEARTDLLPVRLGTEIWQAGRETIIIGFEGTPYAGPATVCQRSRCFELSTIDPLELWQMPNSFGQTFGPVGADWNRPEALISHSSSSGLLAVDLATGRVVRPTVPHASSELEFCGGIPEPDLGGIRALLYDSDIELATLELSRRHGADTLSLATSSLVELVLGLPAASDCRAGLLTSSRETNAVVSPFFVFPAAP